MKRQRGAFMIEGRTALARFEGTPFLWRRLGEVWLRCITTTVLLLDIAPRAYQVTRRQIPEHTVCAFLWRNLLRWNARPLGHLALFAA